MPHRRRPAPPAKSPLRQRVNFRQRYDWLEAQRAGLVARLHSLGDNRRQHPGYKRAFKLLSDTFRNSKMSDRLAVLQAANFLVDILEQVTWMV